jgi:cytidylate kinase
MTARLHQAFVARFGAEAVESLRACASSRDPSTRIVALGGEQLTGKSTLTKALARALGGAACISAGGTMRALADARGLTVAQLCGELHADTSGGGGGGDGGAVDLELDFRTLQQLVGATAATAPQDDSNGGAQQPPPAALVLEGRMPAVLATYAADVLGHRAPVYRCYLRCDPEEVALRVAERELGAAARAQMEGLLLLLPPPPSPPVLGLREAAQRVRAAVRAGGAAAAGEGAGRSWAACLELLEDTQDRDAHDEARVEALYGVSYRDRAFYDDVVDTSSTTHAEKLQLVLEGMGRFFDVSSSIIKHGDERVRTHT